MLLYSSKTAQVLRPVPYILPCPDFTI